jgi:hypothetical protein
MLEALTAGIGQRIGDGPVFELLIEQFIIIIIIVVVVVVVKHAFCLGNSCSK